MKVTITQGMNVATFAWNDAADQCDYTAIGFEDAEIEALIAANAHAGAILEGYSVNVEL